jgi:hypothetical protein
LVLGGTEEDNTENKTNQNIEDQLDDDEAPDDHGTIEKHDDDDFSSTRQGAPFPFSDHATARIRTVKCRR